MEDEETGELFIPCRMCCQKCFRIHGKYHEKERFDGCVSFFKVMLGDFEERLSIPPAFASQFIYEREEHMVLQGPSGQEWDVQLLGTNNTLEFRYGWENFVHYHELQLGDFVVFKYISKLCLKVQIFEKSGCEKDIRALHLEKTNIDLDERCPNQPMLLIDLVCDEENNDTAEPAAENRRRRKKKRKCNLLGHSSKKHGHRLYSQKHMTMELAAPFKSDKPFYKMVMKSWNVNDPHMLEFKKVLDYPIQLPNQKSEVVLLTGECREWKVKCIIKNDRPTFSGGWRYFTRGNNIKEGDICIFEQLNNNQKKFMFRVHIFPHAKKDTLQGLEEEKQARDEDYKIYLE